MPTMRHVASRVDLSLCVAGFNCVYGVLIRRPYIARIATGGSATLMPKKRDGVLPLRCPEKVDFAKTGGAIPLVQQTRSIWHSSDFRKKPAYNPTVHRGGPMRWINIYCERRLGK